MIRYITIIFVLTFSLLHAFGQNSKKLFKLANELDEKGEYQEAIYAYGLALYFDTTLNQIFELRGDCYYELKEWGKAINDYEQVCIPSDTLKLLFRKAHSYYRLDSFEIASSLFESRLELTPNDSLVQYELGLCYYNLSEYDKAYELISGAYQGGYETVQTFYLLGHSSYMLLNYANVIENYSEYEAHFDNDSSALTEKGLAYRYLKQYSQSNECLLRLNVLDDNLSYLVAQNYFDQEQYVNAEEYYNRIQNKDQFVDYYYELGIVYYNLQEFVEAKQFFELSIEKNLNEQQVIQAEYYLAQILEIGENYEEAITYYDKYLTANPTDSLAHWHRGKVFYNEYEYELAIKDFEFLKDWSQKPLEYFKLLGVCYFENDECELSIPALSKSLTVNPEDSSVLYQRGLCNGELLNYREALQDVESFANQNDSVLIKSFFQLNRAVPNEKRMELWKTALSWDSLNSVYVFFRGLNQSVVELKVLDYQRSIALDSMFYEPNFLLGQHYYFSKNYDSASVYYERAIKLKPHNVSLYKEASLSLSQIKAYDKGTVIGKQFLQIAKSDADSLSALSFLVECYSTLDSLGQWYWYESMKIDLESRAFSNPEIKTTYYEELLQRANEAFKGKDYDRALFWYRALENQKGYDLSVLEKKAQCLVKLGRVEEACALFDVGSTEEDYLMLKKKYCKK